MLEDIRSSTFNYILNHIHHQRMDTLKMLIYQCHTNSWCRAGCSIYPLLINILIEIFQCE